MTQDSTRTELAYRCWDDSGVEIEIEADTAEEAAREYVDGGEYSTAHFSDEGRARTVWINVRVVPVGGDDLDRETIKIDVDPPEPPCTHRDGHSWGESGVVGHGGGVRSTCLCAHCGLRRTHDTWAQDPATGEQGLDSVEYMADWYEAR